MHQLFRIPELVELIVQNAVVRSFNPRRYRRQKQTLDLDVLGHPTRRDLLSLGLASKIFLEYVLDALWHTQTGITHLLRVVDVLGTKKVYHYLAHHGIALVSFPTLH